MRHTFAHFAIAFITGAMSAHLFREYLHQLTERDDDPHHFSIDNELLSHPAADTRPRSGVSQGRMDFARDAHIDQRALIHCPVGASFYIGSKSRIERSAALLCAIQDISTHTDISAPHPGLACVTVSGQAYTMYVGERVSIEEGAQIIGPALIETDAWIGPNAIVQRACLRQNCVVDAGAFVSGVEVPAGRYVRAGQVVRNQYEADLLPFVASPGLGGTPHASARWVQ